jgi:hypothetical protein
MGKKLSTYYSDNGNDYCEIHFSYKEEHAYIKYFEESFPNNSLRYVEDAAENWALGHKDISGLPNQQYTLKFKEVS